MSRERKKKELQKADRFFEKLVEFASDCGGQSDDELKRELKNDGIDIDGLIARVQATVRKNLEQEQLQWQEKARQEQQAMIERHRSMSWGAIVAMTREQIISAIQNLLKSVEGEFSVAYRNIDTIEDQSLEELRETLKDLITLTGTSDTLPSIKE